MLVYFLFEVEVDMCMYVLELALHCWEDLKMATGMSLASIAERCSVQIFFTR